MKWGQHALPPHRYTLGVVFIEQTHVGAANLQAEGRGAALRFLPYLLTTKRGEVEVVIAVVELFNTAAIGGVGVENIILNPQERANAWQLFATHILCPRATRPGCP